MRFFKDLLHPERARRPKKVVEFWDQREAGQKYDYILMTWEVFKRDEPEKRQLFWSLDRASSVTEAALHQRIGEMVHLIDRPYVAKNVTVRGLSESERDAWLDDPENPYRHQQANF